MQVGEMAGNYWIKLEWKRWQHIGWSTGAGEGCYGNGLSLLSMRDMAGFPSNEKGFFIPRAGLSPDSLLQLVFPKLDDWYVRYLPADQGVPDTIITPALHTGCTFLLLKFVL